MLDEYTDWFVLMTGRNTRQTQAIAEEIVLRLKHDEGLLPQRREGQREGTWILLDYLDVIVHVFTEETRDYYRLEHLWGQVPVEAYQAQTA